MLPHDLLIHLRETLQTALGAETSCQIGIEANITAASYPLVRLVPTRLLPPQDVGGRRRRLQLTVYFGARLLESADGLDAVYAGLLAMETQIRDALTLTAVQSARAAGQYVRAVYVDTITDEDRLPHYKLMASRFEVET